MAECQMVGWKQAWCGGWEQKHPVIKQQLLCHHWCLLLHYKWKWEMVECLRNHCHLTEQVTPGTFWSASSIAQLQCIVSADVMPLCSSRAKSKRGGKTGRRTGTEDQGWRVRQHRLNTKKETEAISRTRRAQEGRYQRYYLPFSPPPPPVLTVHSNIYSIMRFVGEKAWNSLQTAHRKCIHV